MNERPGFELPLLLVGAFRTMIDDLHGRLAERGYPEARPIHGFALQALGPQGASITELGRRLGVTKQAAAKTVAALEQLRYVAKDRDPDDARATLIRPTARGDGLLALSAEVFEELRTGWVRQLGAQRVTDLERDLELMCSDQKGALRVDLPGWLH